MADTENTAPTTPADLEGRTEAEVQAWLDAEPDGIFSEAWMAWLTS